MNSHTRASQYAAVFPVVISIGVLNLVSMIFFILSNQVPPSIFSGVAAFFFLILAVITGKKKKEKKSV